jgi:hypothetical protein
MTPALARVVSQSVTACLLSLTPWAQPLAISQPNAIELANGHQIAHTTFEKMRQPDVRLLEPGAISCRGKTIATES